MRSADRTAALERVRAVAIRQQGVVVYRHLAEAGLARGEIQRLRADGWLTPVRNGVYLFGRPDVTEWHRVVAVGLVAGPGVALSHSTAARIHRLPCAMSAETVEITAGRGRFPRLAGTTLHRVAILDPADLQDHRGITVTTPARTVVDLAPRLSAWALAHLVDEGLIAGTWQVPALRTALLRSGRRLGARSLAAILAARDGDPRTSSHLEQRAVRVLAGMGPFETQHQLVLDGQVLLLDIAWPEYRVAAECDGWAVRSRSRSKFDHDRRRNNLLEANGWLVAHLTSAMSDEEIRSSVLRLLLRSASGRSAP